MKPSYDLEGFLRRIPGIRTEDNAKLVQQKSRDFYWYSPVLKRQLDAVTADVIAYATSETDVVAVLLVLRRRLAAAVGKGRMIQKAAVISRPQHLADDDESRLGNGMAPGRFSQGADRAGISLFFWP